MIDTHCHIQVNDYDDDRDAVLEEAAAAGVEAIVTPAIDEASFAATLAVTQRSRPEVYCAIGVHPHHASEVTDATLDAIRGHMQHPRVRAVGEIGLDYHYDFSPRDVQRRVFRDQVRIARDAGKPVIVHNRESDDDVLAALTAEQDGTLNGVLHCFSSTPEMLRRALAIGLHISFTANITFKNSALDPVIDETPLENIMLETDSPWMSPPPWRGKRNTPARLRLVGERIAAVKHVDVAEVLRVTTATARRFFGLAALLLTLGVATVHAQTLPPPIPPPEPKPWTPPKDTVIAQPDTVRPHVMPVFFRQLGLGGSFGTSTLIPSQGSTSEANLFTASAQITFMATQAVGFDLRYWRFVDNLYGFRLRHDVDTTCRTCDLNDYYTNFDIGTRFVFNPKNRVTIGGSLGATIMQVNRPQYGTTTSMKGIYGSFNIGINLAFDWGLIQPFGEWRVLFEMSRGAIAGHGDDLVSVPTAGIMYYFPKNFAY